MWVRTIFISIVSVGFFAEPVLRAEESGPTPKIVRAAISRAIPLLEAGMKGSADERKCFTCHNQAVPVFALVEAGKRGFAIDEENLKRQLEHTAAHLTRGRKKYLEGKGQGGKVFMAGYALWMLDEGGWKTNETTSAVSEFLLAYQKDADHWTHLGSRPPSSGSEFATTYVALRGLDAFGAKDQQPGIEARVKVVREWLHKAKPQDREDGVFRLRALRLIGGEDQFVKEATEELLKQQRKDGGWGQTVEMESDAYATGTVLATLLEAGEQSAQAAAVRQGIRYLLDTQREDGSWHVVTRAKGFQTYYESGFPHGKDQFISIAASGWATLALVRSLPVVEN